MVQAGLLPTSLQPILNHHKQNNSKDTQPWKQDAHFCSLQPTHINKCKPVRDAMLSKLTAAPSPPWQQSSPVCCTQHKPSISQHRPISWYWQHHLCCSNPSFICAYQAVQSESLCQVLCIYWLKKIYPEPDSWAGVHSIALVMCLVNGLPHCSRMILPRLFLHDFQDSSTSQVRIQWTNALQRTQRSEKPESPAGCPRLIRQSDLTMQIPAAK